MERFGVARGTVRQAISLLKSEALVQAEQGRGVFVRGQPPVRRLAHDRFARRHRQAGKAAFFAEMESQQRDAEVEVLGIERAPAPKEIAGLLGLRGKAEVVVRRRRYLSEGEPLELATSYVPWKIARGTQILEEDTGPGGIYARLEEAGHRLKRFTEDVSARMPRPDEIRALKLTGNIPVFRLVRVAYDTDEVPLEVCDTLMSAEKYVLSYELPAR